MSLKNYRKLKGCKGLYKNKNTDNFLALINDNGKYVQKTFSSLNEAKRWREEYFFKPEPEVKSKFATLKEVWQTMQRVHFPLLAFSTKDIWKRRYEPWKKLEHLSMDQITSARITEWITDLVTYYRSEDYQGSGRGKAGRCNLNNEINMFVTIFNWYKQSEQFEKEAQVLTTPIKRKHREQGFIKPIPEKKKQISLEDAILFFEYLRPLYKDLAMMQFFTAARIGEIAGMQWKNIDLINRRLIIKETCIWDSWNKVYQGLKPFPKNKEPRVCYITDEILDILKRRSPFRLANNDFVFHVEGKPLNYGTIQVNYRGAQRKSGVPYSGTHILRHGMAKLARKIGGGLDSVMAMTGHKDLKLADHYSKCDEDDQKEVSEKIMQVYRNKRKGKTDNVVSIQQLRKKVNG